jgi:hypothetical protein
MDLLDTKPPKLTKKMSQDAVDAVVKKWKEEELPRTLKARQKETHPDWGGDAEVFKQLQEAVEVVEMKLALKAYVPPPAEVKKCRQCKSPRIPDDALHCYECGLPYRQDKTRADCPTCEVTRNPTAAKFCFNCGYDYQVPDSFLDMMRTMGFAEEDIDSLARDGTVARWKKRSIFDKTLQQDMKFSLAKQKICRGEKGDLTGLFGGGLGGSGFGRY